MRARWMRRAGRLIFLVFLGWLLAIVLGGLGLMPVAGIPLTHVLRPSHGPPPLSKLPKPRQPSVSDLQPAVPAKNTVAPGRTKTTPALPAGHRRSTVAPGQTKTATVAGASHGKSTIAPGQTQETTTAQTTATSVGRSKKP